MIVNLVLTRIIIIFLSKIILISKAEQREAAARKQREQDELLQFRTLHAGHDKNICTWCMIVLLFCSISF